MDNPKMKYQVLKDPKKAKFKNAYTKSLLNPFSTNPIKPPFDYPLSTAIVE